MKIKQLPADFHVEELTDLRPGGNGPFAFYCLEKTGLGTLEAVQAICRKWKLGPGRLSHGGLKDRHGRTKQYLTIEHGPRRGFHQTRLRLTYLGQLNNPYTSHSSNGNRFQLVIRDLAESEAAEAVQAAVEVRENGVPNYFDDQRFGSVGAGRRFVARALIEEDYERALWLALAEPYEHDSSRQKAEKRLIRGHWGDWPTLAAQLPGGQAQVVAARLSAQPGDFRSAVAGLRPDLLTLYLAAYQSHLWNRLLAHWLERECRPDQLQSVELRLGSFPTYRLLDPEQRRRFAVQVLPLPSARLRLDPADPIGGLVQAVMREEELQLGELRLRHFRRPFFSKGDRAVACFPSDLEAQVMEDDRHSGRRQLRLQFTLPRGGYATLVLKRLLIGPPTPRARPGRCQMQLGADPAAGH